MDNTCTFVVQTKRSMKEIKINDRIFCFDDSMDEALMKACEAKLNAWVEEFKSDPKYKGYNMAGLLASRLILNSAFANISKEILETSQKVDLIIQVFDGELSLRIPSGTEDRFVGYEEELREYYEILQEEHPEAPDDALRMNSVVIFCYNNLKLL